MAIDWGAVKKQAEQPEENPIFKNEDGSIEMELVWKIDHDRQHRFFVLWNGRQTYKGKTWPLVRQRLSTLIHYNKLEKIN